MTVTVFESRVVLDSSQINVFQKSSTVNMKSSCQKLWQLLFHWSLY